MFFLFANQCFNIDDRDYRSDKTVTVHGLSKIVLSYSIKPNHQFITMRKQSTCRPN